jgi:hypothetical protein
METAAAQLGKVIDSAYPLLSAISETRASEKPYREKWSYKGVLGHLIDSASNNHQRFVRMQELPHIGTFRYSQEHWVSAQHYEAEPWTDLVELWYRYNRHLVHVVAHIDAGTLAHLVDVGDPQPVTLQKIVEDYVRHVEHHLNQIISGADPRQRARWE